MDALFARDDTIEVRTVHNAGAPPWQRWMLARELGLHMRELTDLNSAGHNIYFGANPRRVHGNPGILAKRCTDALPCGACNRCVAIFRCLFADFDDTTLAEAMHRLDSVSLPRPTLIVISGHGIHVYWLLDDPLTDAIEWRNRQQALSDVLGSDASVNDPARLMRLPGEFLNVKRQPHVRCELVECDGNRAYAIDEFPMLKREPRKPRPPGEATERDRKIARDAVGLLKSARADVYRDWLTVGMVLNSVDDGDDMLALWDRWSEQSDKYQPGDCEYRWGTFDPKRVNGVTLGTLIQWAREDSGDANFGKQQPTLNDDAAELNDDATLVARADPLPLAESFADTKYRDDDGRLLLRRYRAEWWRYGGACYDPASDEALDAEIYQHTETLCTPKRNRSTGEVERDEQGRTRLVPIRPKRSLVTEVRAALPSRGLLVDDRRDVPCWLTGNHDLDARQLLPAANGLLHIPTRTLHPATPDYFATHAMDYGYQPDAPKPTQWLAFLAELWGDDAEAVALLQEWFGYVLTLNLSLHKMLLLIGPKRSGKGTIARVLTAMLGRANVAGPTLSSLTDRFGLSPLLHKPLAIISDARLSGRADSAVVAERLLAVSGEDAITVDIKHRDPVTCTLPTRFMLLTNELPRIADSSGALASRFMVLTLRRSFYGREDTTLTTRLLAELPGILNWALDGWDRLHEQGRFTEPQSSTDAVEDLADLGSPVSAFIRDCCELGEGLSVKTDELFTAWCKWCESVGRDHTSDQAGFGRLLGPAAPNVTRSNPLRTAGARVRFYEGITLKRGDDAPI